MEAERQTRRPLQWCKCGNNLSKSASVDFEAWTMKKELTVTEMGRLHAEHTWYIGAELNIEHLRGLSDMQVKSHVGKCSSVSEVQE